MTASPPAVSEAMAALCLCCVLLMPCAIGGLALINAGLARSRNVSHSLLSALCVLAAAAAAYFVVGGALQGFGTGGRVLILDGKAWGWIGAGRLFLGDMESAGHVASAG